MKTKTICITQDVLIPTDYEPKLDFFETEKAIKLVKDIFQEKLSERLSLQRVSAPRFLITGTGLQDDLAGTQIPVSFLTKFSEKPVEIVHSLAKWKRYALGKYGFEIGKGLYTDMDAIRKDEDISPIHSVYVDQWDWERVISKGDRTLDFLKEIVTEIYSAILDAEEEVGEEFSGLKSRLSKEIKFIHTEELEELYPDKTMKEREFEAAKKYGAIFLMGIGHPLKSGEPHDVRASDYDDWSSETILGTKGLNGDIIVWDAERQDSLELSSMGIRVDAEALIKQLEMSELIERKDLPFQRSIIEGTIPLSIGGGIGQSRLCMLLLQKAHIGEVQSSVWPKEVIDEFDSKKIPLL